MPCKQLRNSKILNCYIHCRKDTVIQNIAVNQYQRNKSEGPWDCLDMGIWRSGNIMLNHINNVPLVIEWALVHKRTNYTMTIQGDCTMLSIPFEPVKAPLCGNGLKSTNYDLSGHLYRKKLTGPPWAWNNQSYYYHLLSQSPTHKGCQIVPKQKCWMLTFLLLVTYSHI